MWSSTHTRIKKIIITTRQTTCFLENSWAIYFNKVNFGCSLDIVPSLSEKTENKDELARLGAHSSGVCQFFGNWTSR